MAINLNTAMVQLPTEGRLGVEKSETSNNLFGAILSDAANAEKSADQMSKQFAQGDPSIGIHEVMIASEKASVAVKFATSLKNKVLEAYREIMSTPV